MLKAPDETRGHQGLASWAVYTTVLLPILYLLSVGPVFRLLPFEPFRLVYVPLLKFQMHCPPLHDFLVWYMGSVWGCRVW
jgi:hypothetical protein